MGEERSRAFPLCRAKEIGERFTGRERKGNSAENQLLSHFIHFLEVFFSHFSSVVSFSVMPRPLPEEATYRSYSLVPRSSRDTAIRND